MNLRIYLFICLFSLLFVSCNFEAYKKSKEESFVSIYPDFFLQKYDSVVLVDKQLNLRIKKIVSFERCISTSKMKKHKFLTVNTLRFYKNGMVADTIMLSTDNVLKYRGDTFVSDCKW